MELRLGFKQSGTAFLDCKNASVRRHGGILLFLNMMSLLLCAGRKIGAEISDLVCAVRQRDPASGSVLNILLTSPGVRALLSHRLAHALYLRGQRTLACVVASAARRRTGIEIHPGATIGRGVLIDHGAGVVIGETAVIGDGCTIYQGVTLGARGGEARGSKRHPTLGGGVLVGAGAAVLGNITIGSGARIGAGAVVLTSIPDGSTAVGAPAKIIKKNKK